MKGLVQMEIILIATIGKNYELGRNNCLIWHIPEDLEFFRKMTMGKKIVMGKKLLNLYQNCYLGENILF